MANNAPPAGWYTRAFSHGSPWAAPVIVVAHPSGNPNNQLWTTNPQLANDEEILCVQYFTMPDVAALTAAAGTASGGLMLEIYVNDTRIYNGGGGGEVDVPFNPALLVRNSANNMLAVHAQATAASPAHVEYGVVITY